MREVSAAVFWIPEPDQFLLLPVCHNMEPLPAKHFMEGQDIKSIGDGYDSGHFAKIQITEIRVLTHLVMEA